MTRLLELILIKVGELSTSGMLLRGALVGCSMFAMVHLLRLWGTRYGDHNTLSKSFILSLVLHFCAFMGWATVVEHFPRHPLSLTTDDGEETHVPVSFVEKIDQAPTAGKNKLPIFHSGASSREMPLLRESSSVARSDREQDFAEVEAPQMEKAPEPRLLPELPDMAAQTQEKAPDLERVDPIGPKSAASLAGTIDQPSMEASPASAPRTTATRASLTRPTTAQDVAALPDFKRGASARATRFIEDGVMLTLPSDIAVDAQPRPQGVASADTIRRPVSPMPAAVVDQSAGSGADSSAVAAGVSNSNRRERINRPGIKPAEGRDDISVRPSVASIPASASRPADDRMLSNRNSFETSDDAPQPGFEKPKAPTMSRAPARAPETYQARTQGQRMSSVLKNGGSEESERAVENSLKWLASVQELDGHWSSVKYGGGAANKDPQGNDRLEGGKFADSGTTGLVLLSFLGAGYTHERGPYTAEVKKGIDWLIGQQLPTGYLGANATRYDQNYCHAIATFALAEAYAMQKDANDYPELKLAVRRGVTMIATMQNEDGGWRYGRGGESDMSMFGWQLMALKSAVNGGLAVPEETRRGMVHFLEARGRGQHGGLAGYKKSDLPTPAMTAEALFCRQIFSVGNTDLARQEATMYLRRNLPRVTAYDEYYWYYGTLAMRNADEQSWKEWNHALRDMLVSLQRADGPFPGSWDPRGKWAGIGGRLYSTALSTMCLEVYYRYQFNPSAKDDE